MRKNLYNVGAILRGFGITFKFMFSKRPTIEYPSIKKQHAPRFHGLHELRRYEDGKERCIGCELCSSACPANAITFGDLNDPSARVTDLAARDRNYALLADIGTHPRTTYLGKIRNPNKEMA